MDADSKLILDYAVAPAKVHDSNEFEDFFDEKDEAAYADSAYAGKKLPKNVRSEVCEKGYRHKPLTHEQKENNRRKSKVRCRIEHVFGFMTVSMHGFDGTLHRNRACQDEHRTHESGLQPLSLCLFVPKGCRITAPFLRDNPQKPVKFEFGMQFAAHILLFCC